MKVKFGICADLHAEFVHDSVMRVDKFLADCEKNKVDFCVELGDFCPPCDTNKAHKDEILKNIARSSIPFYHTLGNHDMDECTKAENLEYLGMDSQSYSFDYGNVHFIVLDANYYEEEGKYYSYNLGDYKKVEDESICVLPPHILDWLKNDLERAKYPSIIFSHQSLIESRTGIKNAPEFREAIKDAPNKVLMAVCGHEHVDRFEEKDGVWYWCLNSMTYYWAGGNFRHTTYGEELEKEFPLLPLTFPYKEPLYAIVTIDDEEITIKGQSSEIVGEGPEELNFTKKGLVDKVTATIEDKIIKL